MLSRAQIDASAADLKFKVVDIEPSGIGKQVHITLKDERTDEKAVIGVWPTTTEDGLVYLISRAAFELRGMGRLNDHQAEWLM